MEYLDDQTALVISRRTQEELSYDVTHPLTRDRIAYIRDHVGRSKYSATPIPTALQVKHRRMVAKLDGFLEHPSRTLSKYKAEDPSIAARYARAIAHYRKPDTATALPRFPRC